MIQTKIEYPIKIQSSSRTVEIIHGAEYGSYEDRLAARARGEDAPTCTCEILDRWKSVVEIRTKEELAELWWALCSGTAGLQSSVGDGGGYRAVCTLADKLLPFVKAEDAFGAYRYPDGM